MEKPKLVKILEETHQESKEEQEGLLVKNAQYLLAENAGTERAILGELGLDKTILQVENMRERLIMTSKLREQHEGEVYHINDIRTMALKYRLKFDETKSFTGAIPPDLPAILARIYAKEQIMLTNGHSTYNANKFRILAPYSMFNNNPKFKFKMEIKTDPMIFYKADEQGEYWLLLKPGEMTWFLNGEFLGCC